MKKYVQFIFFVIIEVLSINSVHSQHFEIKKDTIHSLILNETREILVYIPSELAENKQKQEKRWKSRW
jgi:hypothetical protein